MLILTDLDDTLFQTSRKCPLDGGVLEIMSYLANGEESGFATQRQQRLLGWLRKGHVVPVTARSRDVLARVNVEQTPAICSNGGCIVAPNGSIDLEWQSILEGKAQTEASVSDVYAAMASLLTRENYRHWVVREGDFDLYLVVKSNIDDGEILGDAEGELATCKPADWRTHRNGNNLAFLPPWLNKRDAAQYVIDDFRAGDPQRLIVGIGDSHSDVGFMDLCDYAMTPTTSQLWQHVTSENAWC